MLDAPETVCPNLPALPRAPQSLCIPEFHQARPAAQPDPTRPSQTRPSHAFGPEKKLGERLPLPHNRGGVPHTHITTISPPLHPEKNQKRRPLHQPPVVQGFVVTPIQRIRRREKKTEGKTQGNVPNLGPSHQPTTEPQLTHFAHATTSMAQSTSISVDGKILSHQTPLANLTN